MTCRQACLGQTQCGKSPLTLNYYFHCIIHFSTVRPWCSEALKQQCITQNTDHISGRSRNGLCWRSGCRSLYKYISLMLFSNVNESKLTTASVLHVEASYKVFTATFHTYRGWLCEIEKVLGGVFLLMLYITFIRNNQVWKPGSEYFAAALCFPKNVTATFECNWVEIQLETKRQKISLFVIHNTKVKPI